MKTKSISVVESAEITSVCSAELDELSTIKLRLAAHVACSAMILNFDLDFALLVIKKPEL